MNLILREAVPGDADKLLAYIRGLAEERNNNLALDPADMKLTLEEETRILQSYASSPNSVFLLAEHQDAVVGVLNCRGGRRAADSHVAQMGLSVHRDWRGKGIGSALLRRVIGWAQGQGTITRLELSVFAWNGDAIRLYEKFGFIREGVRRKAWRKGDAYIDDVIMARLL